MYHPSQEMAQLSKVLQIENGKPDFSLTFQKVELHNSTFFQQVAMTKVSIDTYVFMSLF